MSASLTSTCVEPECVQRARPGSPLRRRSWARGPGAARGPRGAPRRGARRASASISLARAARQPVAVDPLRVVRVERAGRWPPATWRCRPRRSRARPRARIGSGTSVLEDLVARPRRARPARRRSAGRRAGGARSGGPSPSASRRGRSGSSPGWPITYSVLPPPMSITSVGSSPGRPLVAPRKVSRASSSPEMIRGSTPKRSRRRLAGTRRRSRRRAPRSWPRRRPCRRRGGRSARDSPRRRPRHARSPVAEPAARVDPLAEPRDLRAALDLDETVAVDVGDQQPGRVGPLVYDTDAPHFARKTLDRPLRRRFQLGTLAVATRGGAVR